LSKRANPSKKGRKEIIGKNGPKAINRNLHFGFFGKHGCRPPLEKLYQQNGCGNFAPPGARLDEWHQILHEGANIESTTLFHNGDIVKNAALGCASLCLGKNATIILGIGFVPASRGAPESLYRIMHGTSPTQRRNSGC
jgi:hypothetical protein